MKQQPNKTQYQKLHPTWTLLLPPPPHLHPPETPPQKNTQNAGTVFNPQAETWMARKT